MRRNKLIQGLIRHQNPSCICRPDSKLPLVEKRTDGFAEKHEVDNREIYTYLPFHLIEEVTNQFSSELKIGSGGYGEVYRGVLNGHEIAVKKLYHINGLDDGALTNEFRQLMKVQHENIIRLIGYCYEIKHKYCELKLNGELVFSTVIDRALCFEYMQGGSLTNHISDKSCIHDWATTYKIIKGTCEGLHYLHEGRGEGDYIYHLDLKPDNILLDKDMVPKITDFGLSRLFGESMTYKIGTCRTFGFMAPEYIYNGAVSPKNDVFSLGVIIFHLVAGRKSYEDYFESPFSPHQELIERVQEYWKKRMRACDAIDLLRVKICIEIAMRCVEKERTRRPSTKDIIDELHKLDAQMEKMSKKDTDHLLASDIVLDPSFELRFPFKPKKEITCCLKLTNRVDCFIAFSIKTNKKKYCTRPSQGILPPFSKSYITVTMRAQEEAPPNMQCLDKLIVQSTRVSSDFTSQEITPDTFERATAVDEVMLPISYAALE